MSFFKKLINAFSKTATANIDLTEIEDALIEADFGPILAAELAVSLKKSKDPKRDLANIIESILEGYVKQIPTVFTESPTVIMLVGVNGSGKTTTVAKLAYMFKKQGRIVDIAACDTFRAAATEQLQTWAERINCGIFKSDTPREPASLAYEALSKTKADVLLIDTAGRLQNNSNLMEELSKISRVLKKINPKAPQHTYITIDATTGQNAFDQVKDFSLSCEVSGLILNKVDGGAKGGVIVRIVKESKVPIVAVGSGESLNHIQKFSIEEFIEELM